MPKLHIKKGDNVKVIAGEDKGKQGRILAVILQKHKALVEGLNMVSKHTKPNATNPQGGIMKKEAPIHISNLMLLDPSTGEPTRIGRKKDKHGKMMRFSRKSNEIIK
ncbi:MAG: 50S ribosomal protein L24 [Bacteroidota bacterium]